MTEVIINCDTCESQYFGEHYDSEIKSGQYGKYKEETYQSHCTNCDKPVFTTRNVKL
ncbi:MULTISPECIES: hypothetical protein [Sporosarcina]|uniref:hypothetical protein n=1 Tax=Sporosarcina TaxID=1569 RepID=UPI0012F4EA67|nr:MULTISPECIES: hypothetical protein [Sporosarcina]